MTLSDYVLAYLLCIVSLQIMYLFYILSSTLNTFNGNNNNNINYTNYTTNIDIISYHSIILSNRTY